ncbi:MAG: 4Fe-4S ferredoxin [Bryobacteraceae bacterium]|nr:4Fe-4S ferredoxin [Bryobacteraceae bacterium]
MSSEVERMSMEVDIVCVGFGPAAGGFLTTLNSFLTSTPEPSKLQVLCYERADDIGFGVSGVVTKARSIRQSFPDATVADIPMAAAVGEEKLVYLLDPHGASRRSVSVKALDEVVKLVASDSLKGVELPYVPDFLHKENGWILSIGQFNQWVGQQVMMGGAVQIWPASPVLGPLIEDGRVVGVRLADVDVRARLTVVADGPVGPVGRALDEHFGMPEGHVRDEWAVGMKAVVELPEGVDLEPGTVFHTIGYPEPEIFGFFYVHPDRLASVGIFVPSWFDNPVRSTYRYLQHFMQHPYLWRYLKGGVLRSWGAKSILESGKRGEPFLSGDGWARIGESSGSTNVLTGSGVDEAWETGTQLAQAVMELLLDGAAFSAENLERTYIRRRRVSWLESEAQVAQHSRAGFQSGFVSGLLGMAMAGFSDGKVNWPLHPHEKAVSERVRGAEEYFHGVIPPGEIAQIREECRAAGRSMHDALMERAGWPTIPFDGQLLMSQQDALLLGGKVTAGAGLVDHVVFVEPKVCEVCRAQVCIEICSGEAIHASSSGGGTPEFDREKCVHCGACLWNCTAPGGGNVAFRAGSGGLHSAEN